MGNNHSEAYKAYLKCKEKVGVPGKSSTETCAELCFGLDQKHVQKLLDEGYCVEPLSFDDKERILPYGWEGMSFSPYMDWVYVPNNNNNNNNNNKEEEEENGAASK